MSSKRAAIAASIALASSTAMVASFGAAAAQAALPAGFQQIATAPITAIVHKTAFQSPSGNIGCMIVGGQARCDIIKKSWTPPAKPASCHLDWAQGLVLSGNKPGAVVCAGDTALDRSAPKLAFNTASMVGNFACVSRSVGMFCVNVKSKHGFFLSEQNYGLF